MTNFWDAIRTVAACTALVFLIRACVENEKHGREERTKCKTMYYFDQKALSDAYWDGYNNAMTNPTQWKVGANHESE